MQDPVSHAPISKVHHFQRLNTFPKRQTMIPHGTPAPSYDAAFATVPLLADGRVLGEWALPRPRFLLKALLIGSRI